MDHRGSFPSGANPGLDCPLCPRLVQFRQAARLREPLWFNSPVPLFGDPNGRLLIVGLAPGLQGANRTGRPFTGDYAGILLYETLAAHGFSIGVFDARPDDGLQLVDCAIANAVRCVPPQNKPLPAEMAQCRPYLATTLQSMPKLQMIVALGRVAHESVIRAIGSKLSAHPFAHGAIFDCGFEKRRYRLFDSYHCSRYNTNTRVLTPDMFRNVFAAVRAQLDADS